MERTYSTCTVYHNQDPKLWMSQAAPLERIGRGTHTPMDNLGNWYKVSVFIPKQLGSYPTPSHAML